MPLVNGIGISVHTTDKQKFFTRFLRTHIKMGRQEVIKQKHGCYYYFDMNAGTGMYKGIDDRFICGSPISFMRAIHSIRHRRYHAVFCEEDLDSCTSTCELETKLLRSQASE